MCLIIQLWKQSKTKNIKNSKVVNQNVDNGWLTVQIYKEF